MVESFQINMRLQRPDGLAVVGFMLGQLLVAAEDPQARKVLGASLTAATKIGWTDLGTPALVVSIPLAALAVADLADRITKRRRAKTLIDHAHHHATGQVTLHVITGTGPVDLATLDPDQLLALLDESPDTDSEYPPAPSRVLAPRAEPRALAGLAHNVVRARNDVDHPGRWSPARAHETMGHSHTRPGYPGHRLEGRFRRRVFAATSPSLLSGAVPDRHRL